jgi:hypothetical protein
VKHLRYLSYVLRHKWYVFVECIRVGLWWRGLVHDMSKFLPSEWTPYVMSFYGPWSYKERPQWVIDGFNEAWLKHQHRNDHHWQYWVLIGDVLSPLEGYDPKDNSQCLPMSEACWKEMVADWRGAGRAQGHGNDALPWYTKNKDNMRLHPDTRALVELELGYKESY